MTAQKREERLQDVPVPVTALTAQTLIDRNEVRVQDYFATVPGLNLTASGNGQSTLAIRGLTSAAASNPTVGVLIDDVPFGGVTGIGFGSRIIPDLDPADLSRIEVLRGPQGTLYGVSSIGGILKFVSADPSFTSVSGRVEGDLNGVTDGGLGYGLRGSINVPVRSDLAVRASVFGRRDPGYADNVQTGQNDVNRAEVFGGQVSALWRPTSQFSLRLAALLQGDDGNGVATLNANSSLKPVYGDLKESDLVGTGPYRESIQLYSATAKLALHGVDLTSISGYGVNKYYGTVDLTPYDGSLAQGDYGVGGAANVNDIETEKFTQEFRAATSLGHRIDLLGGLFYTWEKDKDAQFTTARSPSTGRTAGLLVGAVFPGTYQEYAAYGDTTIHFTQNFDIQLGGRYSRNHQTYHETDTGPVLDQVIFAKSSDDDFTYLVTPRYRLNSDLMAYARIASGYRAGGPNPGAGLGFPATFAPDTTTDYEVGLKGDVLRKRLSYDVSVYYVDWRDIQLSLRDPTSGFRYYINGPKAKSEGVEVSVEAHPWRGLSLSANTAYDDAVLTKNLPAGGGVAVAGDRLPYAERWSGSLSADQEVPITDLYRGFLGVTAAYVGDREGEIPQRDPLRVTYPAYTTVDLRIGVKRDGWTGTLFATNVGDVRGVIGGGSLSSRSRPTDPFFVNYITPRVVGVRVEKAF